MNKDIIETNGITPLESYPRWIHASDSKQFYETDNVCIAKEKPPIECIMQVFVNLSVCSHKIICTPVGKKLLINGVKNIKIFYIADKPCQSVHTAHFQIPFHTFILLGCGNYDVCDIFAAVEDIQIHPIDCRCFSISTLIFICPHYHEKFDCKDKPKCDSEKHDDDKCKNTSTFYHEYKKGKDDCNDNCNNINLSHCINQECESCTNKNNCPYYKIN
ncbi:DUF3794 domain-containing protein [Clostridium sp.]|jgi:hypothetical protein|uniref:DUF3794 domain-containing protein n=1 Tax=Clostridium sp. TaxID=1506 RepID=UPI003A5BC38F